MVARAVQVAAMCCLRRGVRWLPSGVGCCRLPAVGLVWVLVFFCERGRWRKEEQEEFKGRKVTLFLKMEHVRGVKIREVY